MTRLLLDNVGKTFRAGFLFGRHKTEAVRDVTLEVRSGETVGILGESGSGKSTLVRLAAFLLRPTTGSVTLDGVDPWRLAASARRQLRRRLQVVFQEGSDGLDPRQSVAEAVGEPLVNFGTPAKERAALVADALQEVGLTPELAGRYPFQLSGGQRQRVGVARALVLQPELVLLDEPVSALDVSVAAQVLNLLADLQERRGVGYLLITHELPVVRYLADRVAVMFAGRVVEAGPAGEVLTRPAHPYTAAMRAAALTVDPGAGLPALPAVAPPAAHGCPYASRCPAVMPRCRVETPPPFEVGSGRTTRCFLFESAGVRAEPASHTPAALAT
jgi:oligopeptide/dipeptide ABC transporter ATP-binding protein